MSPLKGLLSESQGFAQGRREGETASDLRSDFGKHSRGPFRERLCAGDPPQTPPVVSEFPKGPGHGIGGLPGPPFRARTQWPPAPRTKTG